MTTQNTASDLMITLAICDPEHGETIINEWLDSRPATTAAAGLIGAAATGSPGVRNTAFAVLDRVSSAAAPEVRSALALPQLGPHAAVWLHEHGEGSELSAADRSWLLVDLGVGLLEEVVVLAFLCLAQRRTPAGAAKEARERADDASSERPTAGVSAGSIVVQHLL